MVKIRKTFQSFFIKHSTCICHIIVYLILKKLQIKIILVSINSYFKYLSDVFVKTICLVVIISYSYWKQNEFDLHYFFLIPYLTIWLYGIKRNLNLLSIMLLSTNKRKLNIFYLTINNFQDVRFLKFYRCMFVDEVRWWSFIDACL